MYTTPQIAPKYRRTSIPRRYYAQQTMGDFSVPAPFRFYKATPAARSSPKMNPADNLDEVQVTAQYATATPYADAAMPEVTVSAKRIPWYVWAVLGAVGVSLLLGAVRK